MDLRTGARPASAWLMVGAAAMLPVFCPAFATADAGAQDVATVSEVIVTARKIAEDLQAIPMSVQALSGSYLDSARITRLQELQFAVPGLVVNSTGLNGAGFSLRGIADQRGVGFSVATYLDGVYQGSSHLAVARMFDVDRIEVLKGPQGTLYGRNSTGGAINIIPRPPGDEVEAALELSRGTFDTNRVQGHLNLPSGKLAARAAFTASNGAGYIRNSLDDRRFAEEDYWGVRGSLRIDASAHARIQLMAQHVRDDGGSGDLWLPQLDYLPNPRDIRLTKVTLPDPYLISESDEVSVRAEFDLGATKLRSISGYTRSHVREVDDCAGSALLRGCFRTALPNDFEGWSQELQLQLPHSKRFDALLGAYYAGAESRTDFFQILPVLSPRPVNDYRARTHNPVSAVFGQASLLVGNHWSVTAGLRLSDETFRIQTSGRGSRDAQVPVSASSRRSDVSWRIDLKRNIGEHASVYAGVSTGAKSGGFVPTVVKGVPDAYAPEKLTAYELGLKARAWSGRLALSTAAFLYDFDDLQVTNTGSTGVALVDNAATARIQGLEGEARLAVSDHWSLAAGYVWLPKREFVSYLNPLNGRDLAGKELVRAPEWSGTLAVSHERDLAGLGRLAARLEYGYRSRYFYSPENLPVYSQRAFGLLNFALRLDSVDGHWYAFASGRNLTNADYFTQVLLQSSPGYPAVYEIGLGHRF
jgi:iron complex outermembrane recepter protein